MPNPPRRLCGVYVQGHTSRRLEYPLPVHWYFPSTKAASAWFGYIYDILGKLMWQNRNKSGWGMAVLNGHEFITAKAVYQFSVPTFREYLFLQFPWLFESEFEWPPKEKRPAQIYGNKKKQPTTSPTNGSASPGQPKTRKPKESVGAASLTQCLDYQI